MPTVENSASIGNSNRSTPSSRRNGGDMIRQSAAPSSVRTLRYTAKRSLTNWPSKAEAVPLSPTISKKHADHQRHDAKGRDQVAGFRLAATERADHQQRQADADQEDLGDRGSEIEHGGSFQTAQRDARLGRRRGASWAIR